MRTISALLLLLLAGVVGATDYVYRDNYWWYGGVPYTRSQVWNPGYYSCGYYYQGYYSYSYAAVPNYQAPVTPQTPGWRSKLLDIAAQRDKYESKIRNDAFEHQYFLQSVNALGLQGNFRWNGYGTVPPIVGGGYGVYGSASSNYTLEGNIVNYGATAGTTYGQTFNSLVQDLYGDKNLSLLYQAAAQNSNQSQAMADAANARLLNFAGVEGQNRAKVAEIIAKGQVMSTIMQAMNGPAQENLSGFSFKITPGGVIEKVESGVKNENKVFWQKRFVSTAAAKCAKCHNPKDAKGKFSVLEDYPRMNAQQKQQVFELLVTPDKDRRMPKGGDPLTIEELKAFFTN